FACALWPWESSSFFVGVVAGEQVRYAPGRRGGFDEDGGGEPGQVEHAGGVDAVVAVGGDPIQRSGPAGCAHQADLVGEQSVGEGLEVAGEQSIDDVEGRSVAVAFEVAPAGVVGGHDEMGRDPVHGFSEATVVVAV